MKILVISDSHGDRQLMNLIVERVSADHIIHCGDFCTATEHLPAGSLTAVRGNCDFAEIPSEMLLEKDGYRFFITHGHRYQVKKTLLNLKYRAKEMGAHIICFGHSHYPLCEEVEGALYINPGSIVKPRGFSHPTYACLEISDNSAKVTYYKVDGISIGERGGEYSLRT